MVSAFLLMAEEPEVFDMDKSAEWKALALSLDEDDVLRHFRDQFKIPEKDGRQRLYFLGNSLGLQPKSTGTYINNILDQWSEEGVESFFVGENPWSGLHDSLLASLAKITGALPHEISIMNQLTVNIHLMLVSFYRPEGRRRKILMETKAFPSDQYAVRSYLEHLGLDPDEIILEIHSGSPLNAIETSDIVDAIQLHTDELALVFLGGINYYTGQALDMKMIASAAQKAGCLIGLDLAHAAGNIALQLHDWQVDFACWCSYKYLNGGPGTIGGVFVHEKHHNSGQKRLAGWWGNHAETRFMMNKIFDPSPDASAWQLSTPPMLLLAALKASLDIFDEAGWERILNKQEMMKQCMKEWIESLSGQYFSCITPEARGCQLSLLFPEKGREVYDRLFAEGFMIDWREPNVIRLAPVPLYNTFTEIWRFHDTLKKILADVFHNQS